ncbi:MAG: ribonuclease HI [Clostridiales bacterium]|nr:ribonuclease HI [Clostridiales bacterium]
MKKVVVYTDGACSGNPGPGGWGAVLTFGAFQRELSGYHPATTNNRMELTAAIEALRALKEPCEVALHSDSTYLVNAFEKGWLKNWQRNQWLTASKKPVENQDLWQALLELCAVHSVRFVKVRGHADDALNNRCDQLATGEIKQRSASEEAGERPRRRGAQRNGGARKTAREGP